MTAAQSQRGRIREVKVVDKINAGEVWGPSWHAIRAASGPVDVVASSLHSVRVSSGAKLCLVRYVQVKSSAVSRGPYADFQPAERAEFLSAASRAGAVPFLAWWPPRGELVWIPASDWPRARQATA